MIKVDDEFSIDRDTFGWQVVQSVPGKTREGEPKTSERRTYHANLL